MKYIRLDDVIIREDAILGVYLREYYRDRGNRFVYYLAIATEGGCMDIKTYDDLDEAREGMNSLIVSLGIRNITRISLYF